MFHGNPSGIDVALAVHGGIGLYRRSQGFARIESAPLRLAIGLTGEPRDTAARVADVSQRRAQNPDDTDRRLAELGQLAEAGARALHDPEVLGTLCDEAQRHLVALGLGSPGIQRLRRIARAAGAFGSKSTGAGGGGAVIAVGREDEVAAAWRAEGIEAHVAEVGAP